MFIKLRHKHAFMLLFLSVIGCDQRSRPVASLTPTEFEEFKFENIGAVVEVKGYLHSFYPELVIAESSYYPDLSEGSDTPVVLVQQLTDGAKIFDQENEVNCFEKYVSVVGAIFVVEGYPEEIGLVDVRLVQYEDPEEGTVTCFAA